jgi:hypothetical protein
VGDQLAGAVLAPQRLAVAILVVGDDRVGRVEDGLRRAVVLLELDRGRAGERVGEPRMLPGSAPRHA